MEISVIQVNVACVYACALHASLFPHLLGFMPFPRYAKKQMQVPNESSKRERAFKKRTGPWVCLEGSFFNLERD